MIDFTTTSGTIEIKEIRREDITSLIRELNARGLDVGSDGDDVRHLECCVGPARCEHALIDTIGLNYALGMAALEDQQFPRFPHKFKIRIAGCPNDCIRAVQRADPGGRLPAGRVGKRGRQRPARASVRLPYRFTSGQQRLCRDRRYVQPVYGLHQRLSRHPARG